MLSRQQYKVLIGIYYLLWHAAKFSLPADAFGRDITISTILYLSQLKYSYMNEMKAHIHLRTLNFDSLQMPTTSNDVARAQQTTCQVSEV